MNERLLQYIWERQLFSQEDLCTTDGEILEVLDRGRWNKDQGPDFTGGVVRISEVMWAGHIELHVQTKDWISHGHQHDPGYENVVLHVVWKHTGIIDPRVPVLELVDRVPHFLLEKYEGWMQQLTEVPCGNERRRLKMSPPPGWLDRLVEERLMARTRGIDEQRRLLDGDWEEVFWWQISRSFGQQVNADAFEELARSLKLSILGRHRSQIHQLEALLLGQAQLLNIKSQDPYVILLQREYGHLRHKLRLKGIRTPVKFLRMRPLNFPTVRLAQLAMLIHERDRLFSSIRAMNSPQELEEMLTVTANDFWHYHYRMDKQAEYFPKTVGRSMIQRIIINTVVPMLYAHGSIMKEARDLKKARDWLIAMDPEENRSTRLFEDPFWRPGNAHASQAMIELEKEYCRNKRCLDCEIGNRLLMGHATDR